MTIEEMKGYVDKCLSAWLDTIQSLDITGGECMTIPDAVEGIVEYGTQHGLRTTILSNAFWATSMAKATRTLRRLADKGLKTAVFSIGDNHTKFVPFKNVRTATVAAARLGLETKIRVELHYGSSPLKKDINEDDELVRLVNARKVNLTYDVWLNFVKEGRTYKSSYIQGCYKFNRRYFGERLFDRLLIAATSYPPDFKSRVYNGRSRTA